jgi:hypothetical protein
MTVENDTTRWYAYIDMTSQTEALFIVELIKGLPNGKPFMD